MGGWVGGCAEREEGGRGVGEGTALAALLFDHFHRAVARVIHDQA